MSIKPEENASNPIQGKQLHLGAWTEIIGKLRGIFSDEHFVYLRIDDKVLPFPKSSDEAEQIRERLDDNVIGSKVALLRTDIPGKPLCIRKVDLGARV